MQVEKQSRPFSFASPVSFLTVVWVEDEEDRESHRGEGGVNVSAWLTARFKVKKLDAVTELTEGSRLGESNKLVTMKERDVLIRQRQGRRQPPAVWRANPGPHAGPHRCEHRSPECASSSRSTACVGSAAQPSPPQTPRQERPAEQTRHTRKLKLYLTSTGSNVLPRRLITQKPLYIFFGYWERPCICFEL